MTTESSRTDNVEEEDRVVSRRVDNGTTAGESDRRAYRAADPDAGTGPAEPGDPDTSGGAPAVTPATDDGGEGSTGERARRDLATDNQSEPTRSE